MARNVKTTKTPEQRRAEAEELQATIADDATVFFTRRRTYRQLVALKKERYVSELWEATIEAAAGKFDARMRATRAAEQASRGISIPRNSEAPRVLVSAIAAASLPAPLKRAPIPNSRIGLTARNARAFFALMDGVDLSAEAITYTTWATRWAEHRNEIMRRWTSAPYDPITDMEYAAIARQTLLARRIRREMHRRTRRGQLHPAGMTVERAEQIATAAADGTT